VINLSGPIPKTWERISKLADQIIARNGPEHG